MQYTKEPWEIRGQDIYDADGIYIATWSGTIKNAHRIIDCVNGCAGIINPSAVREAGRGGKMFNKAPNIFRLFDFHSQILHGPNQQEHSPGVWYPARPIGYFSIKHRLKCAWMAFVGNADLIIWP